MGRHRRTACFRWSKQCSEIIDPEWASFHEKCKTTNIWRPKQNCCNVRITLDEGANSEKNYSQKCRCCNIAVLGNLKFVWVKHTQVIESNTGMFLKRSKQKNEWIKSKTREKLYKTQTYSLSGSIPGVLLYAICSHNNLPRLFQFSNIIYVPHCDKEQNAKI